MLSVNDRGTLFSNEENYVFNENVRTEFTKSDKAITGVILPAIADPTDKSKYLPYRDPSNPNNFTDWIAVYAAHQFVNGRSSVISPKTFDADAYDPFDEIYNVLKSNPAYHPLVGIGPDGKKVSNPQLDKRIRMRKRSVLGVVNFINLLPEKAENRGKVTILNLPLMAMEGRGGGTWGLLSELSQKLPNQNTYVWPDITNPQALIPVTVCQEVPPSGGMKNYNCRPVQGQTYPASVEHLKARYLLRDTAVAGQVYRSEVFWRPTEKELLDLAIKMFLDLPGVLMEAFGRKYPGINVRIKELIAAASQAEEAEIETSVNVAPPVSAIPGMGAPAMGVPVVGAPAPHIPSQGMTPVQALPAQALPAQALPAQDPAQAPSLPTGQSFAPTLPVGTDLVPSAPVAPTPVTAPQQTGAPSAAEIQSLLGGGTGMPNQLPG